MGKWAAGIAKVNELISKDDDLLTKEDHKKFVAASVALGAVGGAIQAVTGDGVGFTLLAGMLMISSKKPLVSVSGLGVSLVGIGILASQLAQFAGADGVSVASGAMLGGAGTGAFSALISAWTKRSGDAIRKRKEEAAKEAGKPLPKSFAP